MICHQYKCIFVHIPKNAGQSVEHVFLNSLGLTWETRGPLLLRNNKREEIGPPRLAHLKAGEYVRFRYLSQELFDQYFKFAFVRNPWSRLVSIYKHLGYSKKCDFTSFVNDEFRNKIFRSKSWFVGPQSDFVYAKDGRLLVDYIGRFEDLQKGVDYVSQKTGLPPTQLPHINESNSKQSGREKKLKKTQSALLRPSGNMQSYKTYQEYYSSETIDCVAQLYEKDIRLFGYDFN